MMTVFEYIKQSGIMPVITIPTAAHAIRLAQTLREAGIYQIEVTLRNKNALDCIAAIRESFPDMVIAAGTVHTPEQVVEAQQAGVNLCVTPGINEPVIQQCQKINMPVLPGIATPTEIEKAMELGLMHLKFFPAELMGGLQTIKQFHGPYPQVDFIPTSGMNFSNIGAYLSEPDILAVGGSFMAPADKVRSEDWNGIRELCEKAVKISLNFHLVHVGINTGETGGDVASEIGKAFGIGMKEGKRSDFAGDIIECCKVQFPGTHGHIAIGTRSVERAVAFLEKKGYTMRKDYQNTDAEGNLNCVYLEKEFGGFAIHLLREA